MLPVTNFFQHPMAVVEAGATVGKGTRIWAFAHVLSGAVIGQDCNICDHTFIEGQVRIGDRVTIKCGVYLWDGLILEDEVFVGPAAVFTNDLRPRSRKPLNDIPRTIAKGLHHRRQQHHPARNHHRPLGHGGCRRGRHPLCAGLRPGAGRSGAAGRLGLPLRRKAHPFAPR